MSATPSRRPRRGRTFWARMLAEHAASGLSVEAFCAKRDLGRRTFTRRRPVRELTLPARFMNEGADAPLPGADDSEGLRARNAELESRVEELSRQLEWLRRQVFGQKSERRLVDEHPQQPMLAGFGDSAEAVPAAALETVTYQRRRGKQREADCVTEQGLRFDDSVPVEEIRLSLPAAMQGADYEVVSEKVTHRLAQRPGSYVVLKYVRPVVKRKADGAMLTMPAPDGLWEGSASATALGSSAWA